MTDAGGSLDFRRIFEGAPAPVLVLAPDPPRYTILAASDAYLRATMRDRDMVGAAMFDAFPDNPADVAATGVSNLRASLDRVMATRAPDTMAVQKYDVREGGGPAARFEERWWSPVNAPVLGPGGEILYLLHRVEDVTEYVRALRQRPAEEANELRARLERAEAEIFQRAQDLQAANRELRTAQAEIERLLAKTRELSELKTAFFANVSHELRTPLELVLGPAQKLLAAADTPAAARRELDVIVASARVLLRHVNDLLDVAKVEAGRLRPDYAETDLARAVRLLAGQFESPAAGKRIDYVVDTPPALRAQADPELLECALMNVLANAFRHTPDGGRVRVHLTEAPAEVTLEVADSGPGIPPEQREAVFERFRQLPPGPGRPRGGTGLGLAIARDFVEVHGGTIGIDAAPEGGALVRIVLPRSAPAGVPVRAAEALGPSPQIGAARQLAEELTRAPGPAVPILGGPPDAPLVLIVEDHPEMNRFVAESLLDRYRVATARDGREGLALALELRPDLIVTDLMMPELPGDELVRALRREPGLADTPVVLLTAKAEDELLVRLLREGAQDYLTKPFLVEELRARIDNLVARRRAEVRLNEVLRLREEWLSIVGHDLGQPAAVISTAAEVLRRTRDDAADSAAGRALARIGEALTALNRMIRDLLDSSRLETGRMAIDAQDVDLVDLVGRIVEGLPEAARRSELHTVPEGAAGRVQVRADPVRTGQIVRNLLTNAVRYGDPDQRISILVRTAADAAQVTVTNRGAGIPPGELPYLFERFRRGADRPPILEGLGLGLYIARGLVEAQGGRIWAESRPGETTSFHFTLPRVVREGG